MHPHDYYAPYSDEPKLHNRGAARPYVEPDWQANAAGHQLPVLSTVGRGPRGEGLEIGNVVNEDDTVSFALYSTLTGELVWQSPNLAPSKIEFLPTDFRNLAAGQPALLDIKVTRGGITETTHAYLPCGEQGSLIYTLDAIVPWNRSQTYQTTVNDLIIYGNQHWNNGHKPMPKVNDIIVVKLQEEDKVVLAIADIVQVGSTSEDEIALDSPVVYVVRTTIDNVGPKGDKGDSGIFMVHTNFDEESEMMYLDKTAGEILDAVQTKKVVLVRVIEYDGGDVQIHQTDLVEASVFESVYDFAFTERRFSADSPNEYPHDISIS